ncbi:MAG: hypothetical protein IPI90_03270 [Saprospiraceae bacterium]|nr:hypothetical protein [Candidatus Vicinibacter affinis]
MKNNQTLRTGQNLLVGLFLLHASIGFGQEFGVQYVADHRIYNKAIIASFRGNCQKANENFDAFIQDYKRYGQNYWKDRVARKKLDCKNSNTNYSNTIHFTSRNVLSDLNTGSFRINSRKSIKYKEDKVTFKKTFTKEQMAEKKEVTKKKETNKSTSLSPPSTVSSKTNAKPTAAENHSIPLARNEIPQNTKDKESHKSGNLKFKDESNTSTDSSHYFTVQFATRKESDYAYISLSELGPIYSKKNQGTGEYNYFIGSFNTFNEAKELGLILKENGYSKATIAEHDKGILKHIHAIIPKTVENLTNGMPSCIVIVGSFKSSEKASNLGSQVKRDGFRIFTENYMGFHRVGVEFDCIKDNIDDKLQEMKTKYNSGAWLRK